MIKSFKSKALQAFWERGRAKGIDARSAPKLKRLLSSLQAATKPEDLAVPGYHFHPLTGDRKGQYAVTIRANWRLVFEWKGGNAVHVNEEDYHGR
jgi:toxin HigB-1